MMWCSKRLQVLLVVLVVLASRAAGDVVQIGKCPDLSVQEDFNPEMFAGEWFEIARNPMIVLSSTKCDKITVSVQNNTIRMKSSSIVRSFGKEVTFDAAAYPNDLNETAKMTIQYPLTLFKTNLTIPYWILTTDYYETAIIWSCSEYLRLLHLEYFWIYSRRPFLNNSKQRELFDHLSRLGISVSYATATEHTGCTYNSYS